MVVGGILGAAEEKEMGFSVAVVGDADSLDAVALLTAELGESFEVVERLELEEIAAEGVVGLKSPKLVGADFFVLVEQPQILIERDLRFARLVETRTGRVIGEELLELDQISDTGQKLAAWAEEFAGEEKETESVAIAIMGFGTYGLAEEGIDAQRSATGFSRLLAARLSHASSISVMERRGLGELVFDQDLIEVEKASFASGDYILNGSVSNQAESSRVLVRLNRPAVVDGRWLTSRFSPVTEREIEIQGSALSVTAIEEVAGMVVEMIEEATQGQLSGVAEDAWRPELETVGLHNEAIRLYKLGFYEESRACLATSLAISDGEFFPAVELGFRVRLMQAFPYLEPIEGGRIGVKEELGDFRNFRGETVVGAEFSNFGSLIGPEGREKTPSPRMVWHVTELAKEFQRFLESEVPVESEGEEEEARKRREGASQIFAGILPAYGSIIEAVLDWSGAEEEVTRALEFEIVELKKELVSLGREASKRQLDLPGKLAEWRADGQDDEQVAGWIEIKGPWVPSLDGKQRVPVALRPTEGTLVGRGLPLPSGFAARQQMSAGMRERELEDPDYDHLSSTFGRVRTRMAYRAWPPERSTPSPAELKESPQIAKALEEHFFAEHEVLEDRRFEACFQLDRAFFRAFAAEDLEREEMTANYRKALFDYAQILADMRILGAYLQMDHVLVDVAFSHENGEFKWPYCFSDAGRREKFFDLIRLAVETDSVSFITWRVNQWAGSLALAPEEMRVEESRQMADILRKCQDKTPEYSNVRGALHLSLESLGQQVSKKDPEEAILSVKGFADFKSFGRTIVDETGAWFLNLDRSHKRRFSRFRFEDESFSNPFPDLPPDAERELLSSGVDYEDKATLFQKAGDRFWIVCRDFLADWKPGEEAWRVRRSEALEHLTGGTIVGDDLVYFKNAPHLNFPGMPRRNMAKVTGAFGISLANLETRTLFSGLRSPARNDLDRAHQTVAALIPGSDSRLLVAFAEEMHELDLEDGSSRMLLSRKKWKASLNNGEKWEHWNVQGQWSTAVCDDPGDRPGITLLAANRETGDYRLLLDRRHPDTTPPWKPAFMPPGFDKAGELSALEAVYSFPENLPGTWLPHFLPSAYYDGRQLFLITDRVTDEDRRVCCYWPEGPGAEPIVLLLETPGWENHFKSCDKHSEDEITYRLLSDEFLLKKAPRVCLWRDRLVIYGLEGSRLSFINRELFDKVVDGLRK